MGTHRTPSCIDHIFSNCPNKLINTTTHTNTNSDHSFLTTTYVSQEAIYTPKFIKIRDKKQLTRQNLKTCIDINENFKKFILLQHPDNIANNLQLELNTIIDTVATPKIVQYRKDYQPYIKNDLQTQL